VNREPVTLVDQQLGVRRQAVLSSDDAAKRFEELLAHSRRLSAFTGIAPADGRPMREGQSA
jgi:hypothetical protein